jgi:hypothetical protein
LGNTTTEVSPSTNQSVGGTDDLLGEHAARPVLAHDETTSGHSNEKTQHGKAGGILAEHSSEKDASAVLIAGGSKDESHENGSSNTDDARSPDFFVGEVEILSNFRQKGSNGEPNEKGDEETPPDRISSLEDWILSLGYYTR